MALTTLCVSTTSVHIARTTQTHKEKPSKLQEKDCKHGKEINFLKGNNWLSKQKRKQDM